jgi:hypothetical protein
METAVFLREAETRKRWFAALQFLGFVVLVVALGFLAGKGLTAALQSIYGKKPDDLVGMMIAAPMSAVVTLLATFVMARVTGQPFRRFGLGGRHRLRNLLIGTASGIALLALVLWAMQALGVFSFGPPAEDGLTLLRWGSLYGVMFLSVAISEEFIFRGFALVTLSRALSFWPAAILLSALFGALHLGNGGEDIAGALTAGLFGLALAVTFKWTGSLWLALGLHAGWDYAESFLFGVPDSGAVLAGRAMHSSFHGPVWLTGGSVGPEGSVLVVFLLILIVVIGWLLRERPA